MGIEQHRDRVIGRIKQAVRQSGVDLAAVPAEQQDRLIQTIGDGMLFEFDAILDGINATSDATLAGQPPPTVAAAGGTAHDEQILWEGRPLLSLTERYVLTTERIRLFNGLLSKSAENIELIRLQDIDYTQGISERVLGIGDIVLRSADASEPVAVLNNIKDPEQVSALIRKAWLDVRSRSGLIFREQL
jgi:hypothetical protein